MSYNIAIREKMRRMDVLRKQVIQQLEDEGEIKKGQIKAMWSIREGISSATMEQYLRDLENIGIIRLSETHIYPAKSSLAEAKKIEKEIEETKLQATKEAEKLFKDFDEDDVKSEKSEEKVLKSEENSNEDLED